MEIQEIIMKNRTNSTSTKGKSNWRDHLKYIGTDLMKTEFE